MKKGLLFIATVTLSSSLYAQTAFSRQQAQDLFAAYNPQLLQRARQNPSLQQVIDQLLDVFLLQYPQDNTQNRYTLIALSRNFDNSLKIEAITQQYQNSLYYSQLGGDIHQPAYERAYKDLLRVYPHIWAVSVQVKQALLQQYEISRQSLLADRSLNPAEKQLRLAQNNKVIHSLKKDLQLLKQNVGEQLPLLARTTLKQVNAQVAAKLKTGQQQALQAAQSTNLQIKTNHKKPVAK